jgi:hypothetical protein
LNKMETIYIQYTRLGFESCSSHYSWLWAVHTQQGEKVPPNRMLNMWLVLWQDALPKK